ncbi:hypothetical protein Sjap_007128 [Stephania japonica]|uniref:Uncharacterized protein n=1 Tax=Stephania japonica TaxID=461633 RepID=A0AAP0JMK1_9MAGN
MKRKRTKKRGGCRSCRQSSGMIVWPTRDPTLSECRCVSPENTPMGGATVGLSGLEVVGDPIELRPGSHSPYE